MKRRKRGPFRFSSQAAKSIRRRARIKHAFPADKASARAACTAAAQAHPIARIPEGQRRAHKASSRTERE